MTSKRFNTFLYNLALFPHVVLSAVWDVLTWEMSTARCFVGARQSQAWQHIVKEKLLLLATYNSINLGSNTNSGFISFSAFFYFEG